mmetsp:Transcript_7501/g.14236  ORF Transcript_7501/g.14236 Transcript_7501/m.14236 type:complete len:327 (-) Transcript_7501:373-1353(-)|eukprot:CAMPEP_0114280792 /NCGR_PEP_ID=MMETSP0059-20121206/2631_1 /TAXON_ID=36894 /ORGANISM="Pyramimonas parkeae, Strain CCMP726" /LENGTH=326 /DNA_ID=CAMNT_0001401225 /DNA_START=69 /DNA_END=1049 /DNA_ORIENTATION=+
MILRACVAGIFVIFGLLNLHPSTAQVNGSSADGGGNSTTVVKGVRVFPEYEYHSPFQQCSKHAVVISGGIRTFYQQFKFFWRHVIKPNDSPDVFMHAYLSNETDDFAADWKFIRHLSNFNVFKSIVIEKYTSEIRAAIRSEQEASWQCLTTKPGLRIQASAKQPVPETEERRRTGNVSALRKVFLANELMQDYAGKSGCAYKNILRTRPDLSYYRPLMMGKLPGLRNVVYARWNYVKEEYVSDWLAVAHPAAMKRYAHQYQKFGKLCAHTDIWVPEKLTTIHLKQNKLQHRVLNHMHDLVARIPVPKVCRLPTPCKTSQMSSPYVA